MYLLIPVFGMFYFAECYFCILWARRFRPCMCVRSGHGSFLAVFFCIIPLHATLLVIFVGCMGLTRIFTSSNDSLVLLTSALIWAEEIVEDIFTGRSGLPILLVLPVSLLQSSLVPVSF